MLLAGATLAQAACASFSYEDARHVRHVVGLVHLEFAPASSGTGELVALTTLGLATRSGEDGGHLALGFSRDVILSVPANTCIDIAHPGPCAGLPHAAPQETHSHD